MVTWEEAQVEIKEGNRRLHGFPHLVTMTMLMFYKYHRVTSSYSARMYTRERERERELFWRERKRGAMNLQLGIHVENQKPSWQL